MWVNVLFYELMCSTLWFVEYVIVIYVLFYEQMCSTLWFTDFVIIIYVWFYEVMCLTLWFADFVIVNWDQDYVNKLIIIYINHRICIINYITFQKKIN